MRHNRVKIILALIVTVAVMISSTVSVFAYNPVITIKSSDWIASNSEISYVYPQFSVDTGENGLDFKQYKDLYDESCFVALSKDTYISHFDVDINTSDFKFDGFYIFVSGYKLYIVNFESKYAKVGLDSNGSFYVNVWGSDLHPGYGEINIKTLIYPFNSYYESSTRYFGDNYEVKLKETYKLYPASNLTPIYHTTPVYNIVNGYFANSFFIDYSLPLADVFGLRFELKTPVEMYGGSITFDLTAEQLLRFKKGQYVFKFTNMGFIPFSDCYFAYPLFVLNVIESGREYAEQTVMINTPSVCDVGREEYTEYARAGSCNVDDYIINWNNVFLGESDSVYTCVLSFAFICDVGSAFFPGTVEIVEYDDFEDTLHHYEVLDAIDGALHTDVTVDKIIIDSSGIDSFVDQQDVIIGGIESDLDNIINGNLPDGYGHYSEYLGDSVNAFDSIRSSFAFINTMYDRTVDAIGMAPVILFCLSFGFATYAIGRRLR